MPIYDEKEYDYEKNEQHGLQYHQLKQLLYAEASTFRPMKKAVPKTLWLGDVSKSPFFNKRSPLTGTPMKKTSSGLNPNYLVVSK